MSIYFTIYYTSTTPNGSNNLSINVPHSTPNDNREVVSETTENHPFSLKNIVWDHFTKFKVGGKK